MSALFMKMHIIGHFPFKVHFEQFTIHFPRCFRWGVRYHLTPYAGTYLGVECGQEYCNFLQGLGVGLGVSGRSLGAYTSEQWTHCEQGLGVIGA